MIREVRDTELAALSDVASRSYAHAFGDTYTPHELQKELSERRSLAYFQDALERGHTILVEEEHGRIRGYTQVADVDLPELAPEPGDQLLDRLYVDPQFQGEGVGRRLLETTLAHPRLLQASRVYLQVRSENHRALGLYRSLGFIIVGNTRLGVGDRQEKPDYIMMRPAPVREATRAN